MGFDDRAPKKRAGTTASTGEPEPLPQLQGHTKTYTKVVIEQDKMSLGGQPAEALIGKCVKVLVHKATKWHIEGKVIDASPEPERAPRDYFERLEAARKEALLRQFEADEAAMGQASSAAGTAAKSKTDAADLYTQLYVLALVLQAFGVYLILRSLFL